jgi:hypothetical protein
MAGIPGMDSDIDVPSSDAGGRTSPMRGWGAPMTKGAADRACERRFLRNQKIANPTTAIVATPPTAPPAMAPDEELWVGDISVPGVSSGESGRQTE